ncbi:multicopper oxidase domain protein [Pseudooceanicola batsensis HTCC2597]|uniref:Multicopper oxidase domain protein n=1 Tax=Pseudooceanicola batsensis (strain ATCC BAA-863 / DSM 15984 / KCTC 12145 / HTCC2597) TaxID=252305 RepID=A3TSJ3_PSEBH|nr:multicopper oxidase family protein [Pseudooceanicola batsensis]EAQ04620.1 multicopper oxidase domain protein [Pseudooceanicola batsensis HTCC2597]
MINSTRRTFLVCAAALGGVALLPRNALARAAAPILRAAPSNAQLVPSQYPATPVWAYATEGVGTVPGPEIRVTAGEWVRTRLVNDLPQSTAVHWHGIRIANAMDGAAPLTQTPVEPGSTFDYAFETPDPGTYWYHAHHNGTEQIGRGLAGPLIVEERDPWLGQPGAATRELTLLLADWLLDDDAAIVGGRWDDLHAASHSGRMGNTITVNGKTRPAFDLRLGERVRLRLINAATDRVMPLALPGLSPRLVALDGHPVPPRAVETILLGPAQRADVVIDAPQKASAALSLQLNPGNGEWSGIAGFVLDGDPVVPEPGEVRPLPAWGTLAAPDLTEPLRAAVVMEGGAMRGMDGASFRGERMGFRDLAANGIVWAFNGVAHGLEAPMFRAQRGQTVQLQLTNRTFFPHAIHLHGHHCEVQPRSGAFNQPGDVRDTVMVGADETVDVAFVADNPGKWMLHCHMLSHQQSGMMGWFEVT